jgi:Fe-S-cluster containining protein
MVFGGELINISNTTPGCYELELSNVPCLRCGVCCSKFQPRIDLFEAHLICDKLGLNWSRFLEDFTDHRWPGINSLLIKHVNEACIFLTTSAGGLQSLCSIHEYKPSCCSDWKSGLNKSECQQGLLTKWNLQIDPKGKIYGSKESLDSFVKYLQSL